jgi:hypothetical protein
MDNCTTGCCDKGSLATSTYPCQKRSSCAPGRWQRGILVTDWHKMLRCNINNALSLLRPALKSRWVTHTPTGMHNTACRHGDRHARLQQPSTLAQVTTIRPFHSYCHTAVHSPQYQGCSTDGDVPLLQLYCQHCLVIHE